MLPLLLAMLAATPPAAAPSTQTLRQAVVDAIRNCPSGGKGGEVVVCSKDRGFAEGYRLPKLDPRYAKAPSLLDGLIVVDGLDGAVLNPCATAGPNGGADCSPRQYEAWLAWKREQERRTKQRQEQGRP